MKKKHQEQDKPVIRSTIDRRQLLLGSLTLLCMAALLICWADAAHSQRAGG